MDKGEGIMLFGAWIRKHANDGDQELPGAYRDLIASMGAIEGSLRLVICKALTKTDTQAHQARPTLPRDQLKHDFLTAEEEELIRQKRGKRCQGITVRVVDPSLQERDIRLARWNSKEDTDKDNQNEGSKEKKKKKSTSWWYALTGKLWMELMRVNGLAEGDAIQVWSFRIQAEDRLKLGFVIHKVQRPPLPPASNKSNNNNQYSTKRRRRE